MLLPPEALAADLDCLEEIEKASLRLVVQAVFEFRDTALEIFVKEKDEPEDKAEDATREALDSIGVSRVPSRLFGKMDYKRGRYVFHPQYAIKQALFVDSKAEKGNVTTARINITQTSMRVRQIRQGEAFDLPGLLPPITQAGNEPFLTTTIFVKYNYADAGELTHTISGLTVAALPNGMLQERYNPSAEDGIWSVGPDAPTPRDEKFRTRLNFALLKAKRRWRVQHIPMSPNPFTWDD